MHPDLEHFLEGLWALIVVCLIGLMVVGFVVLTGFLLKKYDLVNEDGHCNCICPPFNTTELC